MQIARALSRDATRTILVIEDDALQSELLGELIPLFCRDGGFEESGWRLVAALGGHEGVELARSIRPDLITLDLDLPDIDGYEVLRQMRAEPALAGVPVIVISAWPFRKDADGGVVAVVRKPFKVAEVEAAVRQALVAVPSRLTPRPRPSAPATDIRGRPVTNGTLGTTGPKPFPSHRVSHPATNGSASGDGRAGQSRPPRRPDLARQAWRTMTRAQDGAVGLFDGVRRALARRQKDRRAAEARVVTELQRIAEASTERILATAEAAAERVIQNAEAAAARILANAESAAAHIIACAETQATTLAAPVGQRSEPPRRLPLGSHAATAPVHASSTPAIADAAMAAHVRAAPSGPPRETSFEPPLLFATSEPVGEDASDVPTLGFGAVELVVGPFGRFSQLADFSRALRTLPGVEAVATRQFYRGTVHLRVRYDDPIPLTTRLEELAQFAPHVTSATSTQILLRVEALESTEAEPALDHA